MKKREGMLAFNYCLISRSRLDNFFKTRIAGRAKDICQMYTVISSGGEIEDIARIGIGYMQLSSVK